MNEKKMYELDFIDYTLIITITAICIFLIVIFLKNYNVPFQQRKCYCKSLTYDFQDYEECMQAGFPKSRWKTTK